MPVVSLYQLRQLDGLLNKRLGALQDSRVSRQLLKRSADLRTYTTMRYKNWNVTSGITIFVNKEPLLSKDKSYTMQVSKEVLTVYDPSGNPVLTPKAINKEGQIVFDQPLEVTDSVEAEFSFRMVDQDSLWQYLYDGMMRVQNGMYMDFDPDYIPSAVAEGIVTAALLSFYESQNTEASFLYNYKVQDQMHDKSQVALNMRETIAALNEKLSKDIRAALWRIGNGRARQVRSVKERYISSPGLRGYAGPNQDGV